MPTNQSTESEHEITIKLSRQQFALVHKVAQLSELEDWEFVLRCIQSRLESALEQAVQDILPIPKDELDNLIEGIAD